MVLTRADKGTPLTYTEMDSNFTGLEDQDGINVLSRGAVGNGTTDDTSAIQQAITDAGAHPVIFPAGYTFKITAPIVITGMAVAMGSNIVIDGTDASVFVAGAIKLDGTTALWHGGTVYTTGTMEGAWGDTYAQRTAVFAVESGATLEDTTIYSQLFDAIKGTGTVNIRRNNTFGGKYRVIDLTGIGTTSRITDNSIYNGGTVYRNKTYASYWDTGGFGIYASYSGNTVDVLFLRNKIRYTGGSSLWIETADYTNETYSVTGLIVKDNIVQYSGSVRAGGSNVTVNDTGTGIEVITCPGAFLESNDVQSPQGYFFAIAYSDDVRLFNNVTSAAVGLDPVVVVRFSDNVLIQGNNLSGGSVGISVGEDDGPSNGTSIIGNYLKDNSHGPIQFSYGVGLNVHNNTFENISLSDNYQGSWAGEPKRRRAVDIFAGASYITSSNNTWKGIYNAIYQPRPGHTTQIMSLSETYECAFTSPKNGITIPRTTGFSVEDGKSAFLPLTAGTGGWTDTGTTTVTSGNQYLSSILSLSVTDFTPYIGTKASPLDYADDIMVLFYIKKTAAMMTSLGADGRFQWAFNDDGALGNDRAIIYAYVSFDDYDDDEWVPITHKLSSAVATNVTDYDQVRYFTIVKWAGTDFNYDLEFTNPVLISLPHGSTL